MNDPDRFTALIKQPSDSPDPNRLFSFIGKASDSPELKPWLDELKAPQPRLKKGDVQAWVALPKQGVELVFSDEASRDKRKDLAVGEGALILDAIMLKSQSSEFTAYEGPLPKGLAFGEAPAQVHEKLGAPARVHPRLPREFWSYDGVKLTVEYDRAKARVVGVTLETPLQS